jgi:hypothetical protein
MQEGEPNALVDLWDRHVSRPNFVGIAVGVSLYAVLWWLFGTGLRTIFDWWFSDPAAPIRVWLRGSRLFWPIYGYAIYVVPGFLAGLIAWRSGVMHGLIVGTSVPVVDLAFAIEWGFGTFGYEIRAVGSGLLHGWLFCGIGGLAADLVRVSLVRLVRAIRAT